MTRSIIAGVIPPSLARSLDKQSSKTFMQLASGQTFEKDDAIGCMANGVACTRATLKTINHPFLEFFLVFIVSNNLLIQ
jgi:hypothetical protein